MVDDKPVLEQVHALQVIVNKIRALKISLPESFQVGAIIAKLPPSWKDYRKKLLHKSEDSHWNSFRNTFVLKRSHANVKIRSVFVGYAGNSKAYRLLDLESNVIVESRDVEFFENKFSTDYEVIDDDSQGNGPKEPLGLERHQLIDSRIQPMEPRRSTRARKEKGLNSDFISSQRIVFLVEDLVKLDRFDGNNYARWKDKMMFLLTALRISYILDPELSPPPEEPRTSAEGVPPDAEEFERVKKERKKREEDELLCRGHILNGLSDRLYDLFTEIRSARDIWSALDYKYKAEEEGTNKYLIAQYFDFVMVDDKPVLEQGHALQVIVNKIRALKTSLPESFQVGAIIAKLPPSWKDYRKKLLHKSEDSHWNSFRNTFVLKRSHANVKRRLLFRLSPMCTMWMGADRSLKIRPCKSVFVGYAGNSKAYRLLDLESNVIVESRDVEFFENKFSTDYEVIDDDSQGNGPKEPLGLERHQLIDSRIQPMEPRRSTRARKEKGLNSDFISSQRIVFLVEGDRNNNVIDKYPIVLNLEDDPRISYILDPELSPPPEEPRTSAEGVPPDAEEFERVKKERKKREEDELLCRGHILNGLSDRLYDLFTEIRSARDIWSALDYKYKAEEEGTNKYLIAQYFDFVMVDDKPVLEQGHALQVIVNKIRALKTSLPESFQVGAIIAKLPPSWKDYRKKLLHKSEDSHWNSFRNTFVLKRSHANVKRRLLFRLSPMCTMWMGADRSLKIRPCKSVFVGYAGNSKAYRLLDLESNVIVESRDVEFFENKFSTDYEVIDDDSQGNGPKEPLGLERHQLIDSRIQPMEPRRSTRARKEKGLNSDFISSQRIVFLVEGDRNNNVIDKYPIVLNLEDDPRISYILDPELSPPPEEPRTSAEGVPPDAEEFERVKKERKEREEDELLCRGHILNGLSDRLYDLFTEIRSARDIWSGLDYKYKAEEEGTNKYLIAQYFDFVMVDDKPVLEQGHALQVIVNKIRALKISLPESFQVGAIIAKLPPSWKDYRKKLLHKSEDSHWNSFRNTFVLKRSHANVKIRLLFRLSPMCTMWMGADRSLKIRPCK
ncbi:hypothetical protein RJ639_038398 [Escallonia herrerae]|uniref:Retroviral polymerase SH3-like domain-containing protein n=1 Tax=Escallonia herrerae TaxID=1293975 RepID=A0AA88WX45_9ASTE|nr:hypothetical protein RJ639_038398 [Escallonia herrerae]